ISTMLVFWSLFSLVRNSVVLAVYLLFSVACFFTVHEHYCKAYKKCGANGVVIAEPLAGVLSPAMEDSLASIGAMGYHFGNAVNMEDALEKMPADRLVMGNVDPAGQFRNGTTESIRKATLEVMEKCCTHDNFIISSGCDIPPMSKWENIDAFFTAVSEYYEAKDK
ncbi:uroporphyrinogen decarboxylase family protein, partial [Gallintestinimicrobium sp.]|uniref:uroporphyrinogen decarboxylase family protein n=3 Tax=Gallintestinimicrobium sp. TaxID=2981655 RepID=UPI003991674B